jgi:hypothetical protein
LFAFGPAAWQSRRVHHRAVPVIAFLTAGLTGILYAEGVIAAGPRDTEPVIDTTGPLLAGPVVAIPTGPVQVGVIVTGGRLSDVQVLQQPRAFRLSEQINSAALPRLRAEAIASGGRHVDTISGATFTSEAYRRSLQAALDAAGVGSDPPAPPPTTAAPATTAPRPATTAPPGTRPPGTAIPPADGPPGTLAVSAGTIPPAAG